MTMFQNIVFPLIKQDPILRTRKRGITKNFISAEIRYAAGLEPKCQKTGIVPSVVNI